MPLDPRAEGLLGYFELGVLAPYQMEPDKYIVRSDHFEGNVSVTNEYYEVLERNGRTNESIDVDFDIGRCATDS